LPLSEISPLSGAIGALVGAVAAYWFSLRGEARKNYQNLRTDAYVDFIRSVAMMASANRNHDTAKAIEASTLVADAKARIAIYGSQAVANELAGFFANHAVLNSEAALSSFVQVVALMRSETPGGTKSLESSSLRQLLFGSEEKSKI
jgi:hypothetical protein